MKSITLPEWFVKLPNDAYINSDEIRVIYRYSLKTKITQLLRNKKLPDPDELKPGFTNHRYLWRVGRVKRLITQMGVN